MKTRIHAVTLVLSMLIAASAYPATISVGTTTARPNGVALVSVEISAATELAGVNLRLEYDPGVLTSPSIVRSGTVLEPSHLLRSHSPGAGMFNVLAYAPLGVPPFSSASGTAFTITLQVAPMAPKGTYPIAFTMSGPALLASSGLSDPVGTGIVHTALAGSVVIRSGTSCDLTGDHQVTCADLLLLLRDWHKSSAVPLLDADINGDTIVDEKDVMIFSEDWQRTD